MLLRTSHPVLTSCWHAKQKSGTNQKLTWRPRNRPLHETNFTLSLLFPNTCSDPRNLEKFSLSREAPPPFDMQRACYKSLGWKKSSKQTLVNSTWMALDRLKLWVLRLRRQDCCQCSRHEQRCLLSLQTV